MPHSLNGISLPADLVWSDEFAWTPVEQAKTYTLDGALLVESQVRQAGRPITLSGGEDRGWVTRDVVALLYALAQTVKDDLALTLADGRQFTCAFRHGEGAIEARPVVPLGPPGSGDYYTLTLRLMAV